MKKIIISIMMISGFSAMAFAQRCTDEQILGMIKLKVPVETVLKACGTEDKREEEIKEKKQKKKRKVREDEDSSVLSQERNGIRFTIGVATGAFSSKLIPVFDHTLTGSAFSVNFVRTNENDLFAGGGYSVVEVSGPWTKQKADTYYDTTLGYFDAYIMVTSFRTTFFYGLIGYDADIANKFSFQPNLRFGLKSANAKWTQLVDLYSYQDVSSSEDESVSGFDLEIDFPFMYREVDSFGIGVDLRLSVSTTTFNKYDADYKFTVPSVFNIMVDFYF